MNAITRHDIADLARTRETPCVSFYTPVGHHRDAKQAAAIRLKNQLHRAQTDLVAGGLRDATAKFLLRPVAELAQGQLADVPVCRGLAIFLTTNQCRVETLPMDVEEAVWVGRRFYIRPLLPLLQSDLSYWLLAVSQNAARLFHGDAHGLTPEPVPTMPDSVDDVVDTASRDGTAQAHTGRQGGNVKQDGVFHGQGGLSDHRKKNILSFFHEIDHALQAHFHGSAQPLVFAGVDYLYPLFAQVTHYPHLVEKHVSGNPDLMTPSELHRASLTILRPDLEHQQDAAIKELESRDGTYSVSDEVHEVLAAAAEGRVKSLLIPRSGPLWGRYDAAQGKVHLDFECLPGSEDLVDRACVEVLAHGGEVFTVGSRRVTRGAPMAAVFRYASAHAVPNI